MENLMNNRGTNGHSVTIGLPKAKFQLVSPEGHRLGIYDSALEAASAAGGFWPGVGQRDHDEAPGWDIHVVTP